MTERRVELDAIDRRLLEALRRDARAPISTLAAKLRLSRGTVQNRLDRLRELGVIESFTAWVDNTKLGLSVSAFVQVSIGRTDWETFRREVHNIQGIEYCALTTGNCDALLHVRVADIQRLRDIIMDHLQVLPGVRATQTLLVLEEVVRVPFVENLGVPSPRTR